MVSRSLAFLRAQALAAFSYPIDLALSITSIAVTLAAFYFIAQYAFRNGTSHPLSSQTYFAFVAVGVLVSGFLSTWLSAFSDTLRELQVSGALEMLLATSTSPLRVVVGITLYDFFFGVFELLVGVVAASLLFGLQLQHITLLPLLLALFLGIITYSGIGLMSAAFVLLFKRGNPILFLFDKASILVGGVYFPVTVMPSMLAKASGIIPLKHILDAVRLAAASSLEAEQNLTRELIILTGFAGVLFSGGMIALRAAMKYVLSRGTVAHY